MYKRGRNYSLKTISVTVEYSKFRKGHMYNCDYLTIRCPYKNIYLYCYRDEVTCVELDNVLSEAEQKEFSRGFNVNSFRIPQKYILKVSDESYRSIFAEYFDYTDEEKDLDLRRIFTTIKLKIIEVYNDVKQYEKYCEGVDLDGSIDGCLFCKHYHKNDYCTKFNIIEPKKACCYYSFNKKLDIDT